MGAARVGVFEPLWYGAACWKKWARAAIKLAPRAKHRPAQRSPLLAAAWQRRGPLKPRCGKHGCIADENDVHVLAAAITG